MIALNVDKKLLHKHLGPLQVRLMQLAGSWTADDYRTFVSFYSRFLPEVMQVERCIIFIIEQGSEQICSLFGTGLNDMQIEPPLEGSLVGQVIKTGASKIINNLDENVGYHQDSDKHTGFVSRNLICSPIRSCKGGGLRGAIQLLNKSDNRKFTDYDLEKLDEIAHFISLSIESVLLNKEILFIASKIGEEV